jgi:hypothetical protein
LYDDGRLDENDIECLDRLEIDLTDDYANLRSDIPVLYQEVYMKKIDSLNGGTSSEMLLSKGKEDIKDAYAKGKITEQH